MYIMYEHTEELKDVDKILYIADLIGFHMKMHCYNGDKEKAHERIRKLVGQREFEDLCILNEADIICG